MPINIGLNILLKGLQTVQYVKDEKRFYELPKLRFAHGDLKPHMSEEQVRIHHEKHHKKYVDDANLILQEFDRARQEDVELDVKAALKKLSFNIGGHVLHSLFWNNLAPRNNGGEKPSGDLAAALDNEFGSFERFRKEFTEAAMTVEGSGWAALALCRMTGRLLIMQIEKHNVNIYPGYHILLVLDMFEHAYYIDYKNEKAKYADAFWNIVNWDEVNKRLMEAMGEKEEEIDKSQ